ncbi:MAG: hypothetical protein PVI76_11480 [Desulfobacterales bacterium]
MDPVRDPRDDHTPPPIKPPVSVHRAFVYSACAPGWGDLYAGFRLRGYAILSAFLLFTAWFVWTLFQVVQTVVGQLFDRFEGAGTLETPELPLTALAISFLGIYFTWLWSMLSAVDSSASRRVRTGSPPQFSVGWAVLISWLCPGSGQVYSSDRRFGVIVFVAYLLGILLLYPAYNPLFQSLSDLARNGQLPANNPYAIIDIIHELMVRVNYSFGKVFQQTIKYFAVAGTLAALRQGPLQDDRRWLTPSVGYGAALLGLGWLCPGSGQLLQGRYRTGWGLFTAYFGSKFLIGLLLGGDRITTTTAEELAWVSIAVQWGSMIEALAAMLIWNRQQAK